MDNVREKIRNIRLILYEDNINNAREELSVEIDRLEAIIDYLEKKNNSLKIKVETVLKEVSSDLDSDLEEIGDILY